MALEQVGEIARKAVEKIERDGLTAVGQIRDLLEKLPDDDLVEIGRGLKTKISEQFMMMCLIANIMASRWDGALKMLAREWGISYTRASEMSSIWSKIYSRMLQRGESPPLELEPEFMFVAVRAPDPVQAISYAADMKAQDKGFGVRQLRFAVGRAKTTSQFPEFVKSCRDCEHLSFHEEIVTLVIPEVDSEGNTRRVEHQLKARVGRCPFSGILQISTKFDPIATASECPEWEVKERKNQR